MKRLRWLPIAAIGCLVLASFAWGQDRQTCAPCHPREVSRFAASAMGNSLSKPAELPEGSFEHKPSGSKIRIYWSGGVMHHSVEERGLTADYPMSVEVGAGKVGRSFLLTVSGHIFQSPASFYTARKQWDVSPGYEDETLLDFNRSITSDCLFCHADAAPERTQQTGLQPIGCDRCHGPTEAHLQNPVPGSIVNPVKLAQRQRESVCEQCHLEGATVVLNPGKYWWDFKPGQTLETVETHYVYRSKDGQQLPIAAVSQAEELVLSKCYRNSAGKLWCGSCHDPHGEPADRVQQMRAICSGCHPANELAKTHQPTQQDCVGCHMPKRKAADIAHAAVTDHQIVREPMVPSPRTEDVHLVPWHEPEASLVQRNRALAEFYAAKHEHSAAGLRVAGDLFEWLPVSDSDDAVQAAKGYVLLAGGKADQAVAQLQLAVHNRPQNGEYWLDLGVAEESAGNAEDAIAAFRRMISLAPWDYRAYEALAHLYKSQGRAEQARKTEEEFLTVVPQSIPLRLAIGQ